MITKIKGEAPFQVLTNSFSISPSNEGYTLQISADGKNYSNLFSVSSGVTRLVTGVAPNSYYRLMGNRSDVVVNWMKTCVTGGGEGGDSNELTPVTSFPVGAPAGTVVALSSGNTVGVYQYDGNTWEAVGGGEFDPTQYYTKSQTNAVINEAITIAKEDLASKDYVGNYVDGEIDNVMNDINNTNDDIEVIDEVSAAAIVYLKEKKVESNDVKRIIKLTQSDYDDLTDPDSETLYIIIDE